MTTRILSSAFFSLAAGVALWITVGGLAAYIGSSRDSREGAAAMGGFFFIGGLAGAIGLALGALLAWRMTADANNIGAMTGAAATVLVLTVGGFTWAMAPSQGPGLWPDGVTAEALVEVRLPAGAAPAGLSFDLRCGGYTLETRESQRRGEGDRVIVPGTFRLRDYQQSWLFAIMSGERQLGSASFNFAEYPVATTEWSEWIAVSEAGAEVRWRVVVGPAASHSHRSSRTFGRSNTTRRSTPSGTPEHSAHPVSAASAHSSDSGTAHSHEAKHRTETHAADSSHHAASHSRHEHTHHFRSARRR